MIRQTLAAVVCLAAGTLAWTVSRPDEIPFQKHSIDLGANEPCAVTDVNGDGKPDLVSGENWYEGPRWSKHKFRSIPFTNNYIDDFSDLPLDVNGDGQVDIVSCAWFSKRLWWNENPGHGKGEWKEHAVETGFNVEFSFLVDIDNDGKAREVLPQFGNKDAPLSWYEPQNGRLVKHVVNPNSYGHGIGAGDVNGDGKKDLVTGKRFMAHNGHDPGEREPLGVYWYEYVKDGNNIEWVKHVIDYGSRTGGGMQVAVADLDAD